MYSYVCPQNKQQTSCDKAHIVWCFGSGPSAIRLVLLRTARVAGKLLTRQSSRLASTVCRFTVTQVANHRNPTPLAPPVLVEAARQTKAVSSLFPPSLPDQSGGALGCSLEAERGQLGAFPPLQQAGGKRPRC